MYNIIKVIYIIKQLSTFTQVLSLKVRIYLLQFIHALYFSALYTLPTIIQRHRLYILVHYIYLITLSTRLNMINKSDQNRAELFIISIKEHSAAF